MRIKKKKTIQWEEKVNVCEKNYVNVIPSEVCPCHIDLSHQLVFFSYRISKARKIDKEYSRIFL